MSTPMTPEQLMEIRLREEAATPGPWEEHLPYGDGFYAYLNGPYLRGVGTLEFGDGEEAEADRAFTLNARQDVPALLAEVDRLRARVAELETVSPWERAVAGLNALAEADIAFWIEPDGHISGPFGDEHIEWDQETSRWRLVHDDENADQPPVSSSYKSTPLPPGEALCTACGHNGAAHHHAGTACWAHIPKRLGEAIRLCPCKAFTGGVS